MGKRVNKVQKWPTRNDQIVLAVLAGATPADVARAFGMTRQNVAKILKSPMAQDVILAAKGKLREKLLEDIEDELDVMSKLALRKLRVTLDADITAVHKAKPNQDRVAMKLLEGRGFLRKERDDGGGFHMSEEQFGKLIQAMEKADAVQEIDPFSSPIEGEFELVEEDD